MYIIVCVYLYTTKIHAVYTDIYIYYSITMNNNYNQGIARPPIPSYTLADTLNVYLIHATMDAILYAYTHVC